MSHITNYYYFNENIDKNTVEAEINYEVEMETWKEGGGGLPRSITWYDNVICESKEDAENTIKDLDDGKYRQIAVKYKKHIPGKKTKALINKEKQVETLSNELYDLDHKQYFKNHKSKRITCKKCDSAINKDYIKRHWCPLCGNDLRNKTEIDKVEKKKEKLSNLKKQIKKMELKSSKKYAIKWLVKVEYHI